MVDRRTLGTLLVCLLVATAGPVLAQQPAPASEQRLALVIGNGAYKEQPLRNPASDARAMTASLGKLGFTVIERIDAGRRSMEEAVLEFGEKLKAGGVGLFYYAGHGVQARGFNYLVPVDAAITSEASVRVQALDVNLVLDLMTDARNRANIVILDSCRNNPFLGAARGSKGLAAIDAGRGTLIAYATSPGAVAVDGDGANSPYTAALVKALDEPGLKVEELFKRVRTRVVDSTQGMQTPWESSSLTGDLVINLSVTVKPAPIAAPAASASRDPADVAFWTSIQASGNSRDFQEYLRQFPSGTFSGLAKRRVDELSRKAAPAPTQQALAASIDPAKKRGSAAELLDRTYANAMGFVLPRIKFDAGPNQGKVFPYRETARDKVMAICVDWQKHVAQAYGKVAAAAGAGIMGWRAASARPGVATAREEALAMCWTAHAAKGCSCAIFDENDQSALKIPDAVVAAVVAPAAAAAPAIRPAANRPAPVQAAKTATARDALRTTMHRKLLDHVMNTPATTGPAAGKPGGVYGQDPENRALAVCVFWETTTQQKVSVGPIVNGKNENPERRRRAALESCEKFRGTRSCACQLVDEMGSNLLELPEDFVTRTLAKPAG